MTSDLLIGEIAKKFGLSTQAIRYYEKLGLIESPRRSAKGYRLYSATIIERLKLIQYAQKFGLSLNQIKELLEVDSLQTSSMVLNNMVSDRLSHLEKQLKQIEITTQELGKRQQQLNLLITNNIYQNHSTIDTYLLDLFQEIEGSLAVDRQIANKAQQVLELYSTGERNFQAIELIGAELNGAFLCDADFSHAEMMLASFNEVSMERTKLNRAYLSGADFIDAYLHQAELIKANLVGADFSGANLTDANLAGCNLGGAKLSNADLTNANLTEAILIGANLTDANLTNAIIVGCNFQEANLNNTILDKKSHMNPI
ncbi:MAG: pentapeptide repeat-containing protein [Cyanobacteria bacterium P01_G01_bin.67]